MAEERVTSFDFGTPPKVQRILLELWRTRDGLRRPRRVRLFYGDPETGKDWNEENETTGYIGRSTGEKPILLLVHNARSLGGGAVRSANVVKIVDIGTGETLYQHPNYHTALFEAVEGSDEPGYGAQVWQIDDTRTLYANCKTFASAYRLAAFMEGKRHNK